MSREQPDTPIAIDSWRNRRRVRRLTTAGLFTIKEVGDACGLPQPVVAQLIPRTWCQLRRFTDGIPNLEAALDYFEKSDQIYVGR